MRPGRHGENCYIVFSFFLFFPKERSLSGLHLLTIYSVCEEGVQGFKVTLTIFFSKSLNPLETCIWPGLTRQSDLHFCASGSHFTFVG